MAIIQAQTEYGMVEGTALDAESHVTVFRGIPYAKAPVGKLRWKSPERMQAWQGVRKAVEFAPICPQPVRPGEKKWPSQSEDCLYLNVWTGADSPQDRLPVVVHIHGGGYRTGCGNRPNYDGAGFAKRGVVFVSFNYRVNVFGFLAHPELACDSEEGNMGLQDQIAAITWVHENISAFGGDPGRVTLMGQSAGAMSISCLMVMPALNEFFNQVIMHSGGGMSAGCLLKDTTYEEALENGKRFFAFCGFDNIQQAREADEQTLLEKYIEYSKTGQAQPFCPVIGGKLLAQDPYRLMVSGKYRGRRILAGCTADEFRRKNIPRPAEETLHQIAQMRFGGQAAAWVRALEEGNERVPHFLQDPKGTDMLAGPVALSIAQDLTKGIPGYVFLFRLTPPPMDQARHGAELAYVFETQRRLSDRYTEEDYHLAEEMADRWAAFAATGEPDLPPVKNNRKPDEAGPARCRKEEEKPAQWQPCTFAHPHVMEIRQDRSMALSEGWEEDTDACFSAEYYMSPLRETDPARREKSIDEVISHKDRNYYRAHVWDN